MEDPKLNTLISLEEYKQKVKECLNNWYPKIPEYVEELLLGYDEEIEELYNENWSVESCAGAIFSCLL